MAEVTLPFLLDILSRGGLLTFSIALFWFLYTERLMPRGRLDDCEEERDRLIAAQVEARERAEERAKVAEADRMRVIQDRDRLRERLESNRRQP